MTAQAGKAAGGRAILVELTYVVAIARHRSFRKAGLELGISASGLSHALKGLETRLGVRLVNRTNRSVTLTAAGQELCDAIGKPFKSINRAIEDLNRFRDAPRRRIRLNFVADAAPLLVGPVMGVFADRYPEIEVDVVVTVLTHRNAGPLGTGKFYVQRMLAAPKVDHHHQPVALVVADSFEQARAATALIRVRYDRTEGRFDLEAQKPGAPIAKPAEYGSPTESLIGDFAGAFDAALIKLDETYTVPDQAHAMLEPHTSIASWDGDKLTCWTSIQQMNWGTRDVAAVLGIPRENVRLISPFIGGGFGGKGTAQTELILAAADARLAKCPVKVALQRPIMFNNTIHRPKTIQRVMLAAAPDGRLTAIGHESWNGNLDGGRTEPCVTSTRTLYAAPNRLTRLHLTTLDLAEGNAMRAPGEAPGLMALEIAMDEMAEKLGMDPVAFRLANDTQIEPEKGIPFSTRRFADCLRIGAEKFGMRASSWVMLSGTSKPRTISKICVADTPSFWRHAMRTPLHRSRANKDKHASPRDRLGRR